MRVTLKDIARQLNMNNSTVSYALNGKGSIKSKTCELIQKTAREMGYVPNQSARQTSTGKSNEVAIVVPNVISIYGEFCEYAFQILSDAGMRSNISISEFSTEREETIVQDLIGKGVAGVLISSSQEFDESNAGRLSSMELLDKHGIPVLCRSESCEHSSVGIDFRNIGIMMGKKLREAGRRHVCMAVPHPPPFYANVNETMAGLKDSLGDTATIRIEYIEDEERTESIKNYGHIIRQMLTQDWYAYHRKLFHKIFDSGKEKPDAIVSPTETCLMAIMNEAMSCGIDVPKDLSLISGTRSVIGYLYPNKITSVYVPEERIARKMVEQLLENIKENKKSEKILLKPEFYSGATL